MAQHLADGSVVQFLVVVLCLALIAAYVHAALLSNRSYRKWPIYRTILWIFALLMIAFSVGGFGIAGRSHAFTDHMWIHLMLGMAAPLLAVLAAPMTLLLRTLPVAAARKVSHFLKSPLPVFISHPVTAGILNTGGMFVLYRSGLYSLMDTAPLLNGLIHLHLFMAGYLFTAAILCIDPSPHRVSYLARAILLILSLAAHGILSKMIYAFPPDGITLADAQSAGKLMYYGGDLVDAFLIGLFCWKWYNAERPRQLLKEIGEK